MTRNVFVKFRKVIFKSSVISVLWCVSLVYCFVELKQCIKEIGKKLLEIIIIKKIDISIHL